MARIRQFTPKEFLDHAGRPYTVIGGTPSSCSNPSTVIELGIHIYTLSNLTEAAQTVSTAFLTGFAMSQCGNLSNYWPRVDVYSKLGSIDECIEHHRAEKVYRKKALKEMHQEIAAVTKSEDDAEEAVRALRGKQPLPHIVPSWACTERFWNEVSMGSWWRYRGFILVIPEECQSWNDVLEKGLWMCINAVHNRAILAVGEGELAEVDPLAIVIEEQISYLAIETALDGVLQHLGDSPWAYVFKVIRDGFNKDNPRRPFCLWKGVDGEFNDKL
ncbi:uncharacterized protein ACLA_066930 [Aspergillus clavatus NRRL 1]|uniref:Uncharacterized protein n=1 Tax=Aspergillus clavatus (strain ATCC 1007 / CBS 513.65 / DSM 816 / NCTC 3887 / NRRL 1 / QM 1276 / 107) TaxID=344612 RepID=A1CGH7_ASPCL|nr:uncharacterized protein ACLA_066930 [Aspergillus clavatus NRRL 1]EAW11057.1 hypothetical protein ACLA_066930 [Aspergillus clavatus NRRL 1]